MVSVRHVAGEARDAAIFALMKEKLYVAVVCDVLDALGYRHQAMHPRLRPLLPDVSNCGLVGRARTLRWMETDYIVEEDPYGLEIEAVDSLRPGDVVVHSTDRGGKSAPWGELMTTVAKRNGAVGCVCDALIRDCTRIIDLGFPGLLRRHVPLGLEGARKGHGLRRAGAMRRRRWSSPGRSSSPITTASW